MRQQAFTDTITIFNSSYAESGESGLTPYVDEYGNPLEIEDMGTDVPAHVTQYRTPEELLVARDVRKNRFTVMVPYDTAIDGTSRVVWLGNDYEVFGEVSPITDNKGKIHHINFMMNQIEGA